MQRKVWNFSGDVNWLDYGGKWLRHVDAGRFHVVELTNMHEVDSSSIADGLAKYVVDLAEVNVDDAANVAEAMRSCGWDDFDDDGRRVWPNGDPIEPLAIAEAMHGYGCKAPLWDMSGNNAWKMIREARAESRALEDPELYVERMSRPVNKLGMTAAEFQRNDMAPALARGLEAGNPAARLVAKMYRACDGQTLGGEIDAATRKVVGL